MLSKEEARAFYDRFGSKQDWQRLYEGQAIQGLLASLPDEIDETWFAEASRGLAIAVGADLALIGRIVDDGTAIQTLGFCKDRVSVPNTTYLLAGTPCESVLGESICVIPRDVTDLYPEDVMLRDLNAVGYAGLPILHESGEAPAASLG